MSGTERGRPVRRELLDGHRTGGAFGDYSAAAFTLPPSPGDASMRCTVASSNFSTSRRTSSLCSPNSGERFTSLYAVRYGFFKSTAVLENGRDQVTGFTMTGELLGLDGIGPERHTCDVVALEDSEVCAIPFAKLQELAHEIPSLQRQLHKTLSREIVREHGVMVLLGSMNAEERLAVYLLNLSQRFAAHGYSPTEFNLRMTREEIGSYLGLKLETISRTLSKFQEERLLSVQQKFIHILDSAGLERVSGRALH